MEGRPPSLPPHVAATLPAEVAALLAEMMQIAPDSRPSTADVLARLQRLAATHATPEQAPTAAAARPPAKAPAPDTPPVMPPNPQARN